MELSQLSDSLKSCSECMSIANRKERKKKILDSGCFILRHMGNHHYLLTVTSCILGTHWSLNRALTLSPSKLMSSLLIEDSSDPRFRKAMHVALHRARVGMC